MSAGLEDPALQPSEARPAWLARPPYARACRHGRPGGVPGRTREAAACRLP